MGPADIAGSKPLLKEAQVSPARLISRVSIASMAVLFAASCDSTRETDPMAGHNHPVGNPSAVRFDSDLANKLRSATAKYHSKAEAAEAGYELASPCVAHPTAGGMGFHWVAGGRVDPVYDPMNPEAVLYGPNGKLVAVEFIVINAGQQAPTFDGHPFDVGGAPIPVPHWTLHVWLYQANPSGLFNAWNPTIVCP